MLITQPFLHCVHCTCVYVRASVHACVCSEHAPDYKYVDHWVDIGSDTFLHHSPHYLFIVVLLRKNLPLVLETDWEANKPWDPPVPASPVLTPLHPPL